MVLWAACCGFVDYALWFCGLWIVGLWTVDCGLVDYKLWVHGLYFVGVWTIYYTRLLAALQPEKRGTTTFLYQSACTLFMLIQLKIADFAMYGILKFAVSTAITIINLKVKVILNGTEVC